MTQENLFSLVSKIVEHNFESNQIPFVAQLVNTPSHTYAKEDVEKAHQILEKEMQELGFIVRKIKDSSERFADHRVYLSPVADQLINFADHATAANKQTIALVGHMDTVFPRDMNFLDFKREEDTIFGPGSLDMKSGLSVCLFALKTIKETQPKEFAELNCAFMVVSDEEVGSPDSDRIYKQYAPYLKCAMVFEAGRAQDTIVTTRKGSASFTIKAKGVAAHSGNYYLQGKNAILGLSYLLPLFEALSSEQQGTSVNVGLMKGGTAKNTVPNSAECVLDVRFINLEDGLDIKEQLQNICQLGLNERNDLVYPRLKDIEFEVSGDISRPPMNPCSIAQQLRLLYESHAEKSGLKIGEAPLQGGGSDANNLSNYGVPCIDGLGPFGKHFHKVEEWSSLTSLQQRTVALSMTLLDDRLNSL